MQSLVLAMLLLVVVLALLWMWRPGARGGNPTSSVDSFHRALSAMSPRNDGGGGSPGDPSDHDIPDHDMSDHDTPDHDTPDHDTRDGTGRTTATESRRGDARDGS